VKKDLHDKKLDSPERDWPAERGTEEREPLCRLGPDAVSNWNVPRTKLLVLE
jgi:hypothetical protein